MISYIEISVFERERGIKQITSLNNNEETCMQQRWRKS